MQFHFILYIYALFLSTLISFGIFIYIWRRRIKVGVRPFGFVMALCITSPLSSFLAHLRFTFKILPFKFDIAPTLLSVGCFFFVYGLFRFHPFDILRHSVIESMEDGMLILDKLGRIIDFNSSAEQLFEGLGNLSGQSLDQILESRIFPEKIVCSSRGNYEIVLKHSYYEVRWWTVNNYDGETKGWLIIFRDITKTKEAQKKLLHQQQFAAMMKERERLARELHDSWGQTFGYINLQAQAIRKYLETGQYDLADSYLQKIVITAQEAQVDIRNFIQDSLRSNLIKADLFKTISNMLQEFSNHYCIDAQFVDLRSNQQPRILLPGIKAQILRIVEEALNNIRKHANATRVQISVAEYVEVITINIEDNGIGFSPSEKTNGKQFGLRIMNERAEEAGIGLSIHSAIGQGTQVVIEIPWRNQGFSTTDKL